MASNQDWVTVFCWLHYRSKSNLHLELRFFTKNSSFFVLHWVKRTIQSICNIDFRQFVLDPFFSLQNFFNLFNRFQTVVCDTMSSIASSFVNFLVLLKNLLQFLIISLSMSSASAGPFFVVEVKVSWSESSKPSLNIKNTVPVSGENRLSYLHTMYNIQCLKRTLSIVIFHLVENLNF